MVLYKNNNNKFKGIKIMRNIKNLNFDWKYSDSFKDEMILDSFDTSSLETVNIPHTNKEIPFNYFDENDTCFVSCYFLDLELLKEDISSSMLLEFDGVSSYAEVFVNGKRVGEHFGGYTQFSFDIANFVIEGKNRIVVKCDSTEREDIPPFGKVVDYLVYGGIYREVRLIALEKNYIKNIFIKSLDPMAKDKPFDVTLPLNNKDEEKLRAVLSISFDGKRVATCENTTSTSSMVLSGVVENGLLWDTESPNLYEFSVDLYCKDKFIDCLKTDFGFRKCQFTKNGFFLNDKKIKIRGLNRHQSYPYVGYAMPKSMQEEDATFLKNVLNVNLVRTSHYPQSQHFINMCDKIGLLVFTEAPGWQHIGGEAFKANFLNSVREMVEQYINHPSIILWGVRVNESRDDDELYIESNKIVRDIDPTRQTGGVRNFAKSHLYEDVYTYNDFVHDGKMAGLSNPSKITSSINSPYLVTEHNGHMYPTKRYDQEKKRIEHALRHARVLDSAYANPQIAGAIGWCMSDYNTHKDFGSGDKICYHGVSDMFRIPKLGASTYISQGDKPYLMPATTMSFGDYDGTFMGGMYLFTNCDTVKLYKNDKLVDTYFKEGQILKNLPHPVFFIPDTVGNLLVDDGILKKADSERLKKVFRVVADKGMNYLKLKHKLTILHILLKYKMTMDEGMNLFLTYLATWGEKESVFTFKGYINGEEVCQTNLSATTHTKLNLDISKTVLNHDITYDVSCVKITCVNQNGTVLPYCFDAITLETEGDIQLIGDKNQALIGGALGVYVKTIKKGEGKLKIKHQNQTHEISFDIV